MRKNKPQNYVQESWIENKTRFFGFKNPFSDFLTVDEAMAALFLAISILSLCSSVAVAKDYKAPEFLEAIANVTVPAGRDVRMACVVDHLGPFKLAWIQRDRSAILTVGKHVITRNPRIGVMHDEHRTWYLIIRNVKPGDAGTYMCQINTEPVTSQIGVIDVVVPPYIKDDMTSKDVLQQEGASATLVCSARGSPIPSVKYRREDGEPIKVNSSTFLVNEAVGPILRINYLTRSDMGAYLCIASNGVPPSVSKRIQVQVKFRPTVYAPHQLVGVPVGQDVNLECYIEAWPLGLNYWKRPKGFEILHNDEKYNVTIQEGTQLYKTRMILSIKNFSLEDIGDYNCISNNSQGGAEQVIRVAASPTINNHPNSIDKRPAAKDGTVVAFGKPGLTSVSWSKENSYEDKGVTPFDKKAPEGPTGLDNIKDRLASSHESEPSHRNKNNFQQAFGRNQQHQESIAARCCLSFDFLCLMLLLCNLSLIH